MAEDDRSGRHYIIHFLGFLGGLVYLSGLISIIYFLPFTVFMIKSGKYRCILLSIGLKYFTGTYIKNNYKCSMTFLTRNMPDLLKKGYLAIYQERARHRARKYMISHKGKIMITRFYNILEQLEAKI